MYSNQIPIVCLASAQPKTCPQSRSMHYKNGDIKTVNYGTRKKGRKMGGMKLVPWDAHEEE